MPFRPRPHANWKLRSRSLALGSRTAIMGVVNITPDSFSDGGVLTTPARAIEHSLALFDEGADVVDIGGESTRPGQHAPITASQETDRIMPALEGILRHRPGSLLSVDTYHAATAQSALDAGVEIINDVSGFLWDPAMAPVCAATGCGVVLMHTRGRPNEWAALPPLEASQVVPLVEKDLRGLLQGALEAGIDPQRIVLDPGFGFGKILDENYALLAGFDTLAVLGRPLLAGVSRKRFLGRALSPLHQGQDAPMRHRANASLAATTAAILAGAHVVRVHEVRPAREAALIADAILEAQKVLES